MMRRQIVLPTLATIRRQIVTNGVNNHEMEKTEFSPNAINHSDEIAEPQHDYIQTTNTQRLILSVGSSVAALVNPHR